MEVVPGAAVERDRVVALTARLRCFLLLPMLPSIRTAPTRLTPNDSRKERENGALKGTGTGDGGRWGM